MGFLVSQATPGAGLGALRRARDYEQQAAGCPSRHAYNRRSGTPGCSRQLSLGAPVDNQADQSTDALRSDLMATRLDDTFHPMGQMERRLDGGPAVLDIGGGQPYGGTVRRGQ
jgi:hypothetical protein